MLQCFIGICFMMLCSCRNGISLMIFHYFTQWANPFSSSWTHKSKLKFIFVHPETKQRVYDTQTSKNAIPDLLASHDWIWMLLNGGGGAICTSSWISYTSQNCIIIFCFFFTFFKIRQKIKSLFPKPHSLISTPTYYSLASFAIKID